MSSTDTLRAPRRRLAAWLVAAVTAGFVYVNVAALGNFLRQRLPSAPRLPLHAAIEDLWALFGVFSHFEVVNRGVAMEGLCESAVNGVPVSSWIELDPDEHFPFPRGEQLSRLAAAREWPGMPCEPPAAARRRLCEKIKARHERLHPGQRLKRVRVSQVTWPRSPRGYDAERLRAGACAVYWYEE